MTARSLIAGNEATFDCDLQGVTDPLGLARFSGHEALSTLFEFHLDLACPSPNLVLADVVGKPALLTIRGPVPRHVHGIVSRFELVEEYPQYALYQATLVPRVWRLKHRRGCRIFQGQNTPDIIKSVLTSAGIPNDMFRFALSDTYEPRDYCVQYRESDLAFIHRLMEEDGLFYFFEHQRENHVMVVADNSSTCKPLPGLSDAIKFATPGGQHSREEHVQRFRLVEEIRPGQVSFRDFNFKRPDLDMEAQHSVERDAELEVYDYPGEYQEPGRGSSAKGGTLARIRLEEHQVARLTGHGESDSERLIPGRNFNLVGHGRTKANARYLITAVGHHGEQPPPLKGLVAAGGATYSNQFSCIPAEVPFRPARMTPRPVVRGVQTAIVVGPEGEEIYTDVHGRVKVQFHWDREGKKDERSSCWIRVSQPWAGDGWGAVSIPRIGQEVLIEFIEGDPDRPIIIGRVYNGANTPPYPLPGQKTKSSLKTRSTPKGTGFNELRFEDHTGSEQVFLHAERDLDLHVKHDSREVVLHDRHETVGSQGKDGKAGDLSQMVYRDKSLKVHRHHTEHIGGDMKLLVGGIDDGEGNVDIVIKGIRKEFVHNDSHLHVTGNFKQLINGHLQIHTNSTHRLEADAELHQKSSEIIIEGTSGITLRVDDNNFIQITQQGIMIQGKVTHINRGDTSSLVRDPPEDAADAAEATPTTPTPADDGSKP